MSEKEEEKSHDNHNDLEYNDGLGDLLREKERFEFSWVKTLASVLVVILVLYLGVTVLFKVAKSMVETSDVAVQSENSTTTSPQDQLVDEILATASETVVAPTENTVAEQAPVPVLEPQTQPQTQSQPLEPTKKTVKPTPRPTPSQPPASVQKEVTKPISKPIATLPVQHSSEPRLTTKHVTKTNSRYMPKKELKVSTGKASIQKPRKNDVKASVAPTGEQTFKVIAGSFITRKNAETLKQQLAAKGIETYIWATSDNQNDTVYRVQVGSFTSKDVAQRQQSELNVKGVETYIQSN